MKNPFIIPTAMICATILAGIWMLKPPSKPPEPPDVSIHDAARDGHIEAVKQHLAAGTYVNAKVKFGWTPLHFVAVAGNKEISELLITNGADMEAKEDQIGGTPLYLAAGEGHKEIAELLIAKGADVNAKNEIGGTPLSWAIGRKHPETADLLRKHGGKTGKELKAEGN